MCVLWLYPPSMGLSPYFIQKTSGDFPTVLFEVVSKRSSVIEGSLSVDELNDILDELSKSMGKQCIIHSL